MLNFAKIRIQLLLQCFYVPAEQFFLYFWNIKSYVMICPPYLKSGDTVAIVAPARKVSPAEMLPAIELLGSWGLKVITGKNLYGSQNQYSGTDEERLADLQQMLDDADVKAIFCARGGYGTLRIIDKIDFSAFEKSPKWIVGFSDVTVLHSHINRNLNIETIHAAMPLTFPKENSDHPALCTLHDALFGKKLSYSIASGHFNRNGFAEAEIIGGNLSILYALSGSVSDIETSGKILFIEDLDEYLYHIDRMMMNLKRAGKLSDLAGLIVGGMSKMNDNAIPFGKNAEEIIAEAVSEYNYPVCFGFPAGHQDDNRAIILGRTVTFEANESGVKIDFQPAEAKSSSSKTLKNLLKPLLYLGGLFALIYLIYMIIIKIAG